MVDLLRIETFLHAAENLNFLEAGRILHLSQPTVIKPWKRILRLNYLNIREQLLN